MEGSFIGEGLIVSRAEMDRALRSYRKLSEVLRVSNSNFRADLADVDESAVRSEMYSIRTLILSVEDPSERLLLYHYYVKGSTLESCGKLLGISLRTVSRLKGRALEHLIIKLQNKKSNE